MRPVFQSKTLVDSGYGLEDEDDIKGFDIRAYLAIRIFDQAVDPYEIEDNLGDSRCCIFQAHSFDNE